MKRVLIINYEFPPLGGGGGVAAQVIAEGLISKGYVVDYLTTGKNGLAKFENVGGINVHRVSVIGRNRFQTASMFSMISFPFMAFPEAVRLCRKNKYDFMHTHFVLPTGPLGYVIGAMFKIKNILFLHGGDIYDPSRKSSSHRVPELKVITRYLLNKANVVVTQSQNVREGCIKFYRPRTKIKVIPLPYVPHEFSIVSKESLGLKEDKKYVIGIGRLVRRKDFKTFVKVISLLDKNTEGIIIGDGPEMDVLKKTAEELNVSDRLHLVGCVSEEKKFQYLANSDAYLLSSLHEGYGIVLLEAMQIGLPIIATNEGGQTDIVEEGVNGFFAEVGDAVGLAKHIQKVFADRELIEKIALNNKKKIERWDLETITNRYLEL